MGAAAHMEGKGLNITLVFYQRGGGFGGQDPLEVAQRAARYQHAPSLPLFCLSSPEMALEYHVLLFPSKSVCNQLQMGI